MDRREGRSPDGRLLVRWDIDHGRMSHEIWTPTILDAATGQALLRIRQPGIDGHPQWRPGGFDLALRSYHHADLALGIRVEVDRGGFRFDGQDSDEPIETLSDRVDEELRRQIDAAGRRADGQRRGRVARDLGIVVLGVATLGAAAWWLPH